MSRLAKLGFTPDLLLIMGSGVFEVQRDELPPDAAVVDSCYDRRLDLFVLYVQSEAFAPVADNEEIPFLKPPVITRK
jgi:hypothetical protein